MTPEPESSALRRVEAYLDQVLAPLARSLSPFQREELRRELRAHLWERVEAYRELGQPEEEAVTEALQQFGGAEDFTRQWRREWRTVDRSGGWRAVWAAARPALRLCVPMLLLTWLLGRSLGVLMAEALPSTYFGALMVVNADALLAAAGAGFLSLSLWAGAVQGRHAPERSGLGMFAALSAVIAAGSALYWLGAGMGLDRTVFGDVFASLPLMAAAWMPTACLAAALTGWGSQRSKARRFA